METPRDRSLDWLIGIPLLTRPMIGMLAGIMAGAAAMGTLLVGLLLGVQGDWDAIPPIAMMFGAVAFGLFLLSLAIMALFFRGRMQTRFVVDKEGIRLFTVDRRARAAARGAILLGATSGNSAAAGSGLLAAAQESQTLRWSGNFHAVIDRAAHRILLRNGWRTLMRVYCRPEDFEAAVALVDWYMTFHGTATRGSRHRPIRSYVVRSVLASIAALPVIMASEPYGFTLLPPFLTFCFSLATIWLVPSMAWFALAGMLWVVGLALAGALAQHVSYFGSGTFRRYALFDGDDWALTALAAAGLAYLAWIAVATLRGRLVPVLQADLRDSGET
jgi:hypothetical protein